MRCQSGNCLQPVDRRGIDAGEVDPVAVVRFRDVRHETAPDAELPNGAAILHRGFGGFRRAGSPVWETVWSGEALGYIQPPESN